MAIKNTPWSSSKAAVAHECRRRYNLKYHLKQKGAPSKNSAGLVGSAVHTMIESLLKGKALDDAYRAACTITPLTTEERRTVREFVDASNRFLTRFNAFCAKRNVLGTHLHIELEVAFKRDGELCDYWDKDGYWRGKWDVGVEVHSPSGLRIIIMDHKTGTPSQDKTDAYTAQLNSYLVSALYAYPELVSAQTVIHWVKEDDDTQVFQWGESYTRERIKEELVPWFYAHYDEANARAADSPVPTAGWYCNFCEYIATCPAHNQ